MGGDAIIQRVAAGNIDFDKCVATPSMMAKLRTVARVLGPRGLMPSPKLGTLVEGPAITKAVKDMKGGRVEYRYPCLPCTHSWDSKVTMETARDSESLPGMPRFKKYLVSACLF